MDILLVIPDDETRDALRVALGPGGAVRAKTYDTGMVLAEQHRVKSIVLGMPSEPDAAALLAFKRLRAIRPEARIIVITARLTELMVAIMDSLRPSAFLDQRAIRAIANHAMGYFHDAPKITPRAWGAGSSDLCH